MSAFVKLDRTPAGDLARQAKWDQRWLGIAQSIAKFSKDPSTQVGAVLTRDNRVVSTGFNGFPRHVNDVDAFLQDRSEKYQRIVHAECNCILNAKCDLEGTTLYVTHPPCNQCSLLVIQAGVVEVVHFVQDFAHWGQATLLGRELLGEAGIAIRDYERTSDAVPGGQGPPQP